MDFLKKIASFFSKFASLYSYVEYNLDNKQDPWSGRTIREVKEEFNNDTSFLTKLQGKPFVAIQLSGLEIIEKEFEIHSMDILGDFRKAFPNFSSEGTIVQGYKVDKETGLALFLPVFKFEPILNQLNENLISVFEVKLKPKSISRLETAFQLIPEIIRENEIEYNYVKALKQVIYKGAIALTLLFGILYFSQKITSILKSDQMVMGSQESHQKIQLDSLKIAYDQLREIRSQNFNGDIILKSQILNEIFSSCPATIKFSKLEVNPTIKKITKDKVVVFRSNKIYLKGSTTQLNSLNKWATQLELKTWIEGISIAEISENSENKRLQFSLDISIK